MHVNEYEQVLKNECILHTVCHVVKFNSEGLNRQIHKLVFNNEISKTIKRLEGNGVVQAEVCTLQI